MEGEGQNDMHHMQSMHKPKLEERFCSRNDMANGNRKIWKARQGNHAFWEDGISSIDGRSREKLNQHNYTLRLKEGRNIYVQI